MSREEAVEAYTAGRISRRTFIRHLVAAGVSVGAAVTYAEVLAPSGPSQASPRAAQDEYPEYPEPEPPVEPPAAGPAGAVAPAETPPPPPAPPPRPARGRPGFTG